MSVAAPLMTRATVEEVPAIYVAHLVDLAGRWGVDAHRLFDRTGVDLAHVRSPGARVPSTLFGEVVRRAVALTDEPALGVYFGMSTRATWHGFLGFAAMSAANLGDVLDLIERFSPTRAPGLRWQRGEVGDDVYLELAADGLPADLQEFVVSWVLVSLAAMAAALVDRPVSGRADLTFAQRPHHEVFTRYFPGPVHFGQPRNRLVVARSVLRFPLASADPSSLQQAMALCERELTERGGAGRLVAEVKARLPRPEGGFKGIDELAGELQMSSRTLRRQLETAGTSYGEELDRQRRERALVLVADRSRTYDAIARELGYSDATNFTRAFRRWTATSPSEFRRR